MFNTKVIFKVVFQGNTYQVWVIDGIGSYYLDQYATKAQAEQSALNHHWEYLKLGGL